MDHAQNGTRSATLDQFAWCSQVISEFLRTFGQPEQLKDDLHDVANFGSDATLWIEPWADKIVAVRNYSQPFRMQPWKAQSEIELVGRCANLCGAWLMGVCWTTIFKEQPPFSTIHGAENFNQAVEQFINQHRSKLTKRVRSLSDKVHYPAWQTLAETMEIERSQILAAFAPKPSPALTREKWIELLEISLSSFERRIKDGDFTVLSSERGRWVLDIKKLPPKMQSPTYFDSV